MNLQKSYPNEFITRKHSSRMRTTRFSDGGGVLPTDPPEGKWDKGQRPLGRNMGPGTDSLEGTWDQASRQEVTSYRDPLCGQTGTCENITLSQTSFAGGKKLNYGIISRAQR